MFLRRLLHRSFRAVGRRHVAGDRDAADLCRRGLGAVEVEIEAGDLGAGLGKSSSSRGAQAGGGPGDDGGVSVGVHAQASL